MKLSSFTISLIFTFISLASSLKTASVMSYYALFTDDFVERFCENTARPEMKCDGKCALSKMLLQEAGDDKTPVNLDWLKNETVLFVAPLISFDFLQLPQTELNKLQYSVLYDFHFSERIIHPPQF
tara:strand:+ start:221 stop:598 length:378 start_codon:yes stop_codon:yes gene_type:complete